MNEGPDIWPLFQISPFGLRRIDTFERFEQLRKNVGLREEVVYDNCEVCLNISQQGR